MKQWLKILAISYARVAVQTEDPRKRYKLLKRANRLAEMAERMP